MLLLIKWLCAHVLGDFAFQPSRFVQHKRRYKAASGYLYLHCLIHAALTYLFTGMWQQWLPPVVVGVTHCAIDLWKLHQKDDAKSFIIDQLLHLAVLLLLWVHVTGNWGAVWPYLQALLNNRLFWTLLFGYAAIIWPAAFLLGFATRRWRNQVHDARLSNGKTSLSEAGRWIGIFERILILTFVVTSHYEGIGFLIAAKSILRFNDLKGNDTHRETEYVLIGTLMSFSISIFTGLVVKYLLQ